MGNITFIFMLNSMASPLLGQIRIDITFILPTV
jgi:hypothetical protein